MAGAQKDNIMATDRSSVSREAVERPQRLVDRLAAKPRFGRAIVGVERGTDPSGGGARLGS
jgi:hypothetical protein